MLATLVLPCLLLAAGCRTTAPPTLEHEHALDEMPSLAPAALEAGELLRVVATTTIVADVVSHVGGEQIELTTLLPPGADPHTFEPTPQDAVAVAQAHILFANGVGLEEFLAPFLASAGADVPVVPVSHGVELLRFEAHHHDEDEHEHAHDEADPHTWFDPHNVILWTYNIERALIALDPANAEAYAANAAAYEAQLEELDAWIVEQVATVPASRRKLVTDHTAFTYFAHRYGFEQVGAVFPGYSTLAQPSAQELAALQDLIAAQGVPAVFVGITVNPSLAERNGWPRTPAPASSSSTPAR